MTMLAGLLSAYVRSGLRGSLRSAKITNLFDEPVVDWYF